MKPNTPLNKEELQDRIADLVADRDKPGIVDLILADRDAAVREAQNDYSWDSWPAGWKKDEKHHRQLVLMQGGKVVAQEVLIDGEFCHCEPYRHGWPTVEACIETWAKIKIAQLQSQPNAKELLGMEVKTDGKLPENGIRFDHPDGRSEGFILGNAKEGE